MTELFLKFKNENDEERQVLVDVDIFLIGRHSENDLVLNYAGISRDHAKIDRFGNTFVISDRGSSHGTTLNGEDLTEPSALGNGDVLNLGGNFEISVECPTEEEYSSSQADADIPKPTANVSPSPAPKAAETSVSWGSFFIIAPLLGFFILLFVGVGIWALSGKSKPTGEGDFVSATEKTPKKTSDKVIDEEPDVKTKTPTPTPKTSGTTASSPKASTPENSVTPESSDTPKDATNNDLEKARNASTAFLRNIGATNETPFLLQKQLTEVNAKIKSYRSSSALRDNLRALKRSLSSVQSAAKENGLKPALIGIAALAKLDNSKGDASALAAQISSSLSKYGVVIGRDSANDNLMILAAEHQGIEAQTMRGKLEVLAIKNPSVNVATVRTVWFLREKDEINSETYNFLIRFAAIGTIAQNPKDFGIDAEPLNF